MEDSGALIAMASLGLAGLGIASAAGLKGWSGWLEIKRLELSGPPRAAAPPSAAARIELADLKERVRKLEAIASGVEL
jgi:hypothetical protein